MKKIWAFALISAVVLLYAISQARAVDNGIEMLLAFALVIAAVLLGTPSRSCAEEEFGLHGKWCTNLEKALSGDTVACMSASDMAIKSFMSIKFAPSEKYGVLINMSPENVKFLGADTFIDRSIVSGKMIVESGDVHDVRFTYVEYGIGVLNFILDKRSRDILLREAYHADPSGEIMIKLDRIQNFLIYSLDGFVEALEECKQLLAFQGYLAQYSPDED